MLKLSHPTIQVGHWSTPLDFTFGI